MAVHLKKPYACLLNDGSMALCANGGRAVLAIGYSSAVNAISSRHGTTNSISSKNTALRAARTQVESQFGYFLHNAIVPLRQPFSYRGLRRVLNTIPNASVREFCCIGLLIPLGADFIAALEGCACWSMKTTSAQWLAGS